MKPKHNGVKPSPRHALNLGCGSSSLPSRLLTELGPASVTSVDISPSCIASMKARYPASKYPSLTWRVADVLALSSSSAFFPPGAFDCVLDKATADVFLSDTKEDPAGAIDKVVRMYCEAWRVVKPGGGGRLVIITRHKPTTFAPIFSDARLGWLTKEGGAGGHTTVGHMTVA